MMKNLFRRKTQMKPAPLLLACVLIASGEPAIAAAAAAGDAPARLAPSCGEWIAHREKSSMLALGDTAWLRGYLAGMEVSSAKDYLAGIDNASIYRWMDNYCRSNPLRDVSSGAKSLAAELAGKKGAPK
jgi:hypothetical protein